MCVLLTILYIVALGKILCQAQVSEEVKYLPSSFLPGRTTIPVNYHQTSTLSQTFTDRSIIFANKNNSDTSHRAAYHNQHKRKQESRKMDENRPAVNPATTYSYRNSTSVQNNTSNAIRDEIKINSSTKVDNIYDKVIFEDDPFTDINFVNSGAPKTRNEWASKSTGAVDPVSQSPPALNVTQRPEPVNVTQPPAPVNVTLEDRSSFDGDACPTGYVRVNGVCVMPD